MELEYNYELTLKYNKGYFDDEGQPLVKKATYSSTSPRTKEWMQGAYPMATIINIKEIK